MAIPFVPDDFGVPAGFMSAEFSMEPLGAQHNERDHVAWMSSVEHILSTPGFEGSDWPAPMTLEANLADLVKHARDFDDRTGFTYSILDEDDVIGCLYIYPSSAPDHDASVRSWVAVDHSDLDVVVWKQVSDWLVTRWPFENPLYAPRTQV
ncbi:MAG: N-acetyltransferase [Actinomycetia bacterium]|nr:N-acetyltransferase [Actinomycetes bacterium]